jgi:hypothetical protein
MSMTAEIGGSRALPADSACAVACATEFLPVHVHRAWRSGGNDNTFGVSLATAFFGFNRPNTPAPTGRIDRGVAIAQDGGGRIYALFDAEYQIPDFDFGLARLTVDLIFAGDFE